MKLYLVSFANAWQIVSAPSPEQACTGRPHARSAHLLSLPEAQAILNSRPGQFCGYHIYTAPYTIRQLESGDWQVLDALNNHVARTSTQETATHILNALLAYKP